MYTGTSMVKYLLFSLGTIGLIAGIFYQIIFTGVSVYVYERAREQINKSMSAELYKTATTSLFWVGERESSENRFITNVQSAWDGAWLKNFGGVDNPLQRCGGFKPCGFTPKENPFYFALPYNDLDKNGKRKKSAELVPWFEKSKQRKSILKNRWIEIIYGSKTCYAQWEDVGPFHEDDFEYVFKNAPAKNTEGVSAALDISPAVWSCLGLETNTTTSWRFVDELEVPDGPWKEIITKSDVSW